MTETKLKQKRASIDDWEMGIGALTRERISVEKFFGIEPLRKNQVVLDLGCGKGANSVFIAKFEEDQTN